MGAHYRGSGLLGAGRRGAVHRGRITGRQTRMRPAGTWVNPPIERGNRRRWEVLAPGVVVTHSHLDHTASVILTREESRGLVALVVDPAWAPDELHDLAKDVAAWEAEVVAG